MAANEFKFDQRELQNLVRLTGTDTIGVSICGLRGYGGLKTFYLCAVSMKSDGGTDVMNTSIRPIIGCPFPPPWNDDLLPISHGMIEANPKFIVNALELGDLLQQNSHTPQSGTGKLVSVVLEARINTDNELESFVSFVMKDTNGNQVGEPLIGLTR